jgi:phospholipase/carboxylesterase
MRLTRRALLGLAGAALLAACAPAPTRSTHLAARPSGRTTQPPAGHRELGLAARDAYLYVPASAPSPAPLVVWLHGAGGSGREIDALVAHADALGAIVLAPGSRGPTWGVVSRREAADLEFLDRALDEVFMTCAIDPRRIALAGFSDGASAALCWGLVNGDLFGAIAAFSPGMLRIAGAVEGRPRIFVSHGTRDPIFPIERSGRPVADTLRRAGYAVELREFDAGHTVPADVLRAGLAQSLTPT